jgi:hypothetical protein
MVRIFRPIFFECFEFVFDIFDGFDHFSHRFTLSAAQRFPKAMYYLGMCYDSGMGVSKDRKQAFHW